MRSLRVLVLAFVAVVLLFPNDVAAFRVKRKVAALGKSIHPHALYLVTSSEILIAASKHLKVPSAVKSSIDEMKLSIDIWKMPSTTVIAGINILVYGLWTIGAYAYVGQHKWLLRHMERHFIFSGEKWLRRQLPHSYLTSGFSHKTSDHIFANLLCLFSFGEGVEKALGRRKFIYLYMSSIFVSNRISLGLNGGANSQGRGSLGASGAISAIQAYSCLRFPNAQFKIGEYVFRAPWACLIWSLMELYHLASGEDTGIGHGSHLGGYIFGALFYLINDIVPLRMKDRFGRWKLPARFRRRLKRLQRWYNIK